MNGLSMAAQEFVANLRKQLGAGLDGSGRNRLVDGLARLQKTDLSEVEDGVLWCEGGVPGPQAQRCAQEGGHDLGPLALPWLRQDLRAWLAGPWIGATEGVFGAMESPVIDVVAVFGNGALLHTRRRPRSAAGPDPRALVIGRDNRTSVLVSASLRALPNSLTFFVSRHYATFADACAGAARLARTCDPALVAAAVLPGRQPDAWCHPRPAAGALLVACLRRWSPASEPLPWPAIVAGEPDDESLARQWFAGRHGPDASDTFMPAPTAQRFSLVLPWRHLDQLHAVSAAIPDAIGLALDTVHAQGCVVTLGLGTEQASRTAASILDRLRALDPGIVLADDPGGLFKPVPDPLDAVLRRACDPAGNLPLTEAPR